MKKIPTILCGGVMALALAACNTTDTTSSTSGSSSVGATGTGNPVVDAQMGISPNVDQTGMPNATGTSSTPTNTGHTTTGPGVTR